MAFLQILLTSFLMVGVAMAAPDPSSTPTQIPATSNAPATIPTANNKAIEVPVQLGVPVKGIKIPQYDDNGKLTMCLTADTALKLNDHQVELNKLKVQFDEKEEKEIVVEIPHSILNLDTKKLSADSETLIRREDFEIVGETAEFDTLARQGTFKGRVHASFRNEATIVQP